MHSNGELGAVLDSSLDDIYLVTVQGNLEERKDKADPQSNVFGSLLTTFGSVEVGGRNFFKLLQNGECVLLYPGGVREVCSSSPAAFTVLLMSVA